MAMLNNQRVYPLNGQFHKENGGEWESSDSEVPDWRTQPLKWWDFDIEKMLNTEDLTWWFHKTQSFSMVQQSRIGLADALPNKVV